VFSWGLLLWALSIGALLISEDDILVPSVVLIGSFLVPVSAIFWFAGRDHDSVLSVRRLMAAFFIAGVVGLLAAAVLETWLLPSRHWPNLWVGLIEEAFKGIGVLWLARGLKQWSVRDGVLLGTTVGLGFGAFEAAGYTFSWGMTASGFSFSDMISEEVLRAAIAPFCHGVWTGLLGAAIFASRGRVTLGVVVVYVAVSLLHAVWDAGSTVAIVATVLASGTAEQREDLRNGIMPLPSSLDPQWFYGLVQWTVMILAASVGVLWLRRRWVRELVRA